MTYLPVLSPVPALAEAHRQRDRCNRWLDRVGRLAQLRRALSDDRAGSPNIEQSIRDLEVSEHGAQLLEDSHKEALRQLQEITGAISQAVTTIATRLPAEVCDCPVCATQFDEPSRLRERASSAAERLAPLLVAQEQQAASAIKEREALTVKLADQRAVLARIRAAEEKIAAEVAAIADLEAVFGVADTFDVAMVTQLLDGALQDARRLSWRLQRREFWRRRLSEIAGVPLAQELAVAAKRRDDLARAKESASRHAILARQTVDAALADIATREGMLGLEVGRLSTDIREHLLPKRQRSHRLKRMRTWLSRRCPKLTWRCRKQGHNMQVSLPVSMI
jgi:DNA repair protein SbcC/Rad50